MSVRSDVLLWAQRIAAKKDGAAHQLLELPANASLDDAQQAFHKIARLAHPDLHRTTLDPAELEQVTLAYARVASAYQDFRTQRQQPPRAARTDEPSTPRSTPPAVRATPAPGARPGSAPPVAPAQGSGAAGAMSSKALIYYRKAELSLRRGDLRGALLQIKMAIAADPQSAFLRTALTEVEAEVLKNP